MSFLPVVVQRLHPAHRKFCCFFGARLQDSQPARRLDVSRTVNFSVKRNWGPGPTKRRLNYYVAGALASCRLHADGLFYKPIACVLDGDT